MIASGKPQQSGDLNMLYSYMHKLKLILQKKSSNHHTDWGTFCQIQSFPLYGLINTLLIDTMHDVQNCVLIIGNTRVILSTIISSLIFLISVAVYATMIYYEDRKALLYNSNWIQSEEDIDFLRGKCHAWSNRSKSIIEYHACSTTL